MQTRQLSIEIEGEKKNYNGRVLKRQVIKNKLQ